MPKYYEFKIAGYYLYFTSHCIIECMHVHASDRKLTESGSAKFFVRENGDTVLQNRGILNDREIRIIQGWGCGRNPGPDTVINRRGLRTCIPTKIE